MELSAAELHAGHRRSHIAEMVINGSTMSIVSMTKKLNELPEASPEVRTLAKDFIHDQEHYIGEMKSFLC